jgi:hypothetical protein
MVATSAVSKPEAGGQPSQHHELRLVFSLMWMSDEILVEPNIRECLSLNFLVASDSGQSDAQNEHG